MTSVCVAGATGWTGRAVAEAVLAASDLDLRSTLARETAGKDLGEAWGGEPIGVQVLANLGNALDGVDVLVDYTSHVAAKDHTLVAVGAGSMRDRLIRPDRRRLRRDRRRRSHGRRRSGGGRQLLSHRRDGTSRSAARRAAPAVPGDRRLRLGREAGRTERHGP